MLYMSRHFYRWSYCNATISLSDLKLINTKNTLIYIYDFDQCWVINQLSIHFSSIGAQSLLESLSDETKSDPPGLLTPTRLLVHSSDECHISLNLKQLESPCRLPSITNVYDIHLSTKAGQNPIQNINSCVDSNHYGFKTVILREKPIVLFEYFSIH